MRELYRNINTVTLPSYTTPQVCTKSGVERAEVLHLLLWYVYQNRNWPHSFTWRWRHNAALKWQSKSTFVLLQYLFETIVDWHENRETVFRREVRRRDY